MENQNQSSGFKQKMTEVINNISLTINIITIVLYIVSLIIWTATKANNPVMKTIAIISILIYIVLFVVLVHYSSSEGFTKNINVYKRRIKNINKLLKLLNLVIVFISTISLFTFTKENVIALAVNTAILVFNIISIIVSYLVYRIIIKIKNRIKSTDEVPKSFIGHYFGTENYIKIKK